MGWRYFLLVICWSVFFIPVIYFFWPETAKLSLEEIGKQFGDEVAVHLNDATDEEKAALDSRLTSGDMKNPTATTSDARTQESEEGSAVKNGSTE